MSYSNHRGLLALTILMISIGELVSASFAASIAFTERQIGLFDGPTFSITETQQANAHNDSNLTEWDFGNGQADTTTEPTTSVTYNVARTYTVTLVVEDENGVESEAVTTTVSAAAPVVVP